MLLCAPSTRATLCSGSRLFEDAVASGYTSIAGDLVITNWRQANLGGSLLLASLSGLYVSSNPGLRSLSGLRVGEVNRDVVIEANRALTNLTEPGALATIRGNVYVFANEALTNLDGFAGSNISGRVSASTNRALTSVEGLCSAVVAGSVRLQYGSARAW